MQRKVEDLRARHPQHSLACGETTSSSLAEIGVERRDAHVRRPIGICSDPCIHSALAQAHLVENVEEPSALTPEETIWSEVQNVLDEILRGVNAGYIVRVHREEEAVEA